MPIELLQEDLLRVMARLPSDVRRLLQQHPYIFIGGGCVRAIIAGEQVSDIDLFGPSREVLAPIAQALTDEREGRLYATDNAFTVLTLGRLPVQFIHRWGYGSPAALLADFDFSIAQTVIYWDAVTGQFRSLISEFFYADLAAKRLRYLAPNRAEDAGGSMIRVKKFIARGYHIETLSLGKVIARLMSGVKGQFAEPELAPILTALLREVDPLTVIDGVEMAIPREAASASETPDEDIVF